MILGHYAVAFGAKCYAPRASLGTLIFAAILLDLLCSVFLLLGWERVRIVPGLMSASPLDFEHYPISHSLLSALVLAGVLGGAYLIFRRYPRGAAVLALAVISHWVLDLPMHRPDLPLWPGSDIKLGFGLWNSIPGTLLIELSLLAAGVVLYTRVTHPRDHTGTRALLAMVGFLVIIFLVTLFGPPPPNQDALAIASLTLWLTVPWGYWTDRQREPSRLHGPLS